MDDGVRLSVLIASAFAAGVINSIAGGGTLITFSVLLGFGMRGVFANATSTVALLPGSLSGAWGFRRQLADVWPWIWLLLGPSLVGGVIGTLLVTRLAPSTFDLLIPWLLLIASLLFLLQPTMKKLFPPHESGLPSWPVAIGLMFFQLLVAVYGGYFGAGIGILMLSSLGLMGVGDIHRMNAVKTILAAAMNAMSVIIFALDDKIYWQTALIMAIGAIAGGYAGATLGQRLPRELVRWLVIVLGLALAVYYFIKPSG